MVSKSTANPLSSIFAQYQKQENDSGSHEVLLSYRILLETSYSLKARIAAAEPVENPHLYERAGLATPSECALRDIHGASETGWLLHLIELSIQQQRQNPKVNGDNDDNTTDESGHTIFVATKSRNDSIVNELPQPVRRKLQVIDIGSNDPFGWEEINAGTNDGKTATVVKMSNLRQVYRRIKEEIDRNISYGRKPVVIWQSLTPLIVFHGFRNIFRLLCALPPCLQVWPVNSRIISPKESSQLEDASNAILYSYNGEMSIMRQGIRERGNVLRQKLPFRLKAIVSDRTEKRRFRIVEESEDESGRKKTHDDYHKNKVAKALDNESNDSSAFVVEKNRSNESTNSRSRGAHVHIEENDGGRSKRNGDDFSSGEDVTASTRPRIYLEDDDPEFDDFDEEDPDDDLDI